MKKRPVTDQSPSTVNCAEETGVKMGGGIGKWMNRSETLGAFRASSALKQCPKRKASRRFQREKGRELGAEPWKTP